jgi:acyl transferase domain-containing protein/acyl carrier protein
LGAVFPQARDTQEYWRNLVHKIDCVEDVPSSRWKIENYYDQDPTAPDKVYCRRGGFIPDIRFDPVEFGLPPLSLEVTDTAQLLSLFVAREALKDAGYGPDSNYDHSRTGVVLGVAGTTMKLPKPLFMRLEYPVLEEILSASGLERNQITELSDAFRHAYVGWNENAFPGFLANIVAGRISNRLNLGGMNCTVDAACASSLCAVNLAVSALEMGQCEMVLAGGVDTDNSIAAFMSFAKTGTLSRSEQIRPFSRHADGTLIAEGLGMFVLKRLEDARRDNDRVYAVIRGIGAASDGRSKSIYAPYIDGQIRAMQAAYESAGFLPNTISLVEAHAPGTRVGDATEFSALKRIFSSGKTPRQQIALGSVKSQIGHSKAAAGAASMIKAILALHHRVLPPTLNVEEPNPELGIEDSPFYLNTEPRPWIRDQAFPRRAAVNSLGFGGANYHVILEEAPESIGRPARFSTWDRVPDSAQTATKPEFELPSSEFRETVAVFPGQGSQYLHMGRELAIGVDGYREIVEEFDSQLTAGGHPPLSTVLFPLPALNRMEESAQEQRLKDTLYAQASIGALSMAHYQLLSDRGFRPGFLLGHSFGELTALWAAGALTNSDYIGLVCARGEALTPPNNADAGGLISVQAELSRIETVVAARDELTIANINAPDEIVVGGPIPALREAEAHFRSLGCTVIPLKVAAAFHTRLIDFARKRWESALEQVSLRTPGVPVFSNTTGLRYPDAPGEIRELLRNHPFQPVLFSREVQNISADGGSVFVEIGPRNILSRLIEKILKGKRCQTLALNPHRQGDSVQQLERCLQQLRLPGVLAPEQVTGSNEPESRSSLGIEISGAEHISEETRRKYAEKIRALGGRLVPLPAIKVPAVVEAKNDFLREAADYHHQLQIAALQAHREFLVAQAEHSKLVSRVTSQFPAQFSADRLDQEISRLVQVLSELAQTHQQYLEHQKRTAGEILNLLRQNASHPGPDHLMWLDGEAAHPEKLPTPREASAKSVPQFAPVPLARPATGQTGDPPINQVRSEAQFPDKLTTPPPNKLTTPSPENLTEIQDLLVAIIAEKTGYPKDVIKPGMDLEADLGIDSIKRVEILAAVQQQLMFEPDSMRLEEARTIGEVGQRINDFLAARSDPQQSPVEPQTIRDRKEFDHNGSTGPAEMAEPTSPGNSSSSNDHQFSIPASEPNLRQLSDPTRLPIYFPKNHSFLILADGGPVAKKLCEQLAERKIRAVVVLDPSAEPEKTSADDQRLPQSRLRDWSEETLKSSIDALTNQFGPLGAALRLWENRGSSFDIQRKGLKQTVALAKLVKPSLERAAGLGRAGFLLTCRLDGSLGVSADSPDLLLGAIFGLIKTARHESPNLHIRGVDLGPLSSPDMDARRVVDEFFDATDEPAEVGYSPNGRITIDWIPVTPVQQTTRGDFGSDQVYLVTGGARGITAACVTEFARMFGGRFVLLGRTQLREVDLEWAKRSDDAPHLKRLIAQSMRESGQQPTPDGIERVYRETSVMLEVRRALSAISDAGGEARYIPVDVKDRSALEDALAPVLAEWGPFTGLIHAAGALADKRIEELGDRDFETVFGPKVDGLLSVLEVIDRTKLKFCALFSSAAAVFGNPGQAIYAMANEFLNKVASQLQRELPAARVLSYCWGPWDGGMVTPELKQRFSKRGIRTISMEEGRRLFTAFASERNRRFSQLVISDVLAARKAKRSPLYLSRRFGINELPFVKDHQIEGWPVLPAAWALAWMAQTGEELFPGYHFRRADHFRVLKGIVFDDKLAEEHLLIIQNVENGASDCSVEALLASDDSTGRRRLHYSAQLYFSSVETSAPSGPTIPTLQEISGIDWKAYRAGLIQYGTTFLGVDRLLELSERRISTRFVAPHPGFSVTGTFPVNALAPHAYDLATHGILIWLDHFHHCACLPAETRSFSQYRPLIPDTPYYVTLDINNFNPPTVEFSFATLDAQMRISHRAEGLQMILARAEVEVR